MYGFTLAISCCVKTSNILSIFVKYIDVPLFKAVIDTITNPYDIYIKKTLWPLFVDGVQLSQG